MLLALVLSISASTVIAENVLLLTSKGEIEIELFRQQAPETVKNFLTYVDRGAYDNTIFHRVIPGFMIQTGGHFDDLTEAAEGDTVRNEADNGLHNTRGTLAMARMDEIDSASRQFFINVGDNTHLDHSAESCTREDEQSVREARIKGLYKPVTCSTFGYAVFGRVVRGMNVVDDIELVETESRQDFDDVPVETIYLLSTRKLK